MTYIVLHLCPIEPLVRNPILPAREPSHSAAAPKNAPGSGHHAFGSSAWRIPAPSCALCPRRPAAIRPTNGSRRQSGLHRQTAHELGPSSATSCTHPGALDQPVGRPGPGGTSPGQGQPWVESGFSANWRWNFNISRIVWPPKRWREPTICLSGCSSHLHR